MATNAVIGALRVNLGIDTAAFQDGLKGAQKSLGKIGRRLQRTGQDLSVRVSAPLAAIGGLSLKAFSDFEKGLIGVGKTTDIAGDQLAELGRGVQELAREVPVATTELLGIAQAAGQLGVTGTDNILRFTATVGKLGIASNLSGEAAATALARILTVTGESVGDVDRLGSTIVRLGNNFAATESEIAEASTRVGQATSQFGIAASDVVGIGAALTAVGVKAEAGGTVIGRAFQSINDAVRQGGKEMQAFSEITGRTAADLQQMFQEDPTQAFQALVEGLGRINAEGGDVTSALESMGLSGVRVVQVLGTLATRSDVLGDALNQANSEWRENAALNREAAVATESFAAQTQLARNALSEAATTLGRELAPAANQLLTALAGLARWFSQLNPDVLKFGAVVGALAIAVGPVLVGLGLLASAIAAVGAPIAGVIAGIGLLTAAIIAFWDDVEPVVSAVGAGFKQLWQNIINDIERVKIAFESFKTTTERMVDQTRTMVEKIDHLMGGRLKKAFDLPKSGAKGLVNTIRDMANEIVGNSIIPDMVDNIEREFKRFDVVMAQQSRQTTENVETNFSSMATGIGNEITGPLKNAFRQGEMNFQSFGDALVSIGERLRNRLLDRVFAPIESALDGFLGGLLGGIFGGGASFPTTLGGANVGNFSSAGPLAGFHRGGSFTVGGAGGIDNNLVAFRATRGEQVTVTPRGGQMARGVSIGDTILNITQPGMSEHQLRRVLADHRRETIRQVVDLNERDPSILHT